MHESTVLGLMAAHLTRSPWSGWQSTWLIFLRCLESQENVHFVRLEGGSAILVQKIDETAEPKVRARAPRQ